MRGYAMNIKNPTKPLIITVSIILILVLSVITAMQISGHYKSDPNDIVSYDTDNPFITGKTEVIAHRLGGGIAPEESMLAIHACTEVYDADVDIFEFDLRITKDNQAVVFHDSTLDDHTDAETVLGEKGLKVSECSLEELRKLNIGAKYTDANGQLQFDNVDATTMTPAFLTIMTLEEALEHLTMSGADRFSIECKDDGELGKKAMDILYSTLKGRNLLSSTVVSSFKTDVSEYAHENYPDMIMSNTDAQAFEFYIAAITNDKDYIPPCTVFQVPYTNKYLNMGINFGTAKIINYAHSHNVAIHYWTVNDKDKMEYLKSIGADGIMSDYPDILTQTIK